MNIKIESMVDAQRLILMSQGEVFIWHIQQHLEKGDTGGKDISKGKVGCKICGKTVKDIFNTDRNDYLKFMDGKYNENNECIAYLGLKCECDACKSITQEEFKNEKQT